MQKKRVIGITFLIICLFLFGYYFFNNLSEFKSIRIVDIYYLIYFFLALSFNLLLLGWVNKYHLIPFNIKLSFKEWFGLAAVTSFYNVITPFKGGLAVRAAYLKKKRGLNYAHFLSSLAALAIIMFIAPCILGLISLGLLYYFYGIFNWIVFIIFLISFFVFLSVFIMPKINSSNKIIVKLNQSIEGWHEIRKNKNVLIKIFLINIFQIVLSVFAVIFAYKVFGIQLSFIVALFLVCLGNLGGIISLTPANLGFAEAIGVFSAFVVGISPVYSISVSILWRIVHFCIIGILGPLYSYILLKHNPK